MVSSQASKMTDPLVQQANWVSLVQTLADSGSVEDERSLPYISALFHNAKQPFLPEVKSLVDAIDEVVTHRSQFDGKKISNLAKVAFTSLQRTN